MKPLEAMDYLGITSRDAFSLWCEKVQIQFYQYEFSNRKYLISGEFFAKADYNEILRIKEIHGDRWHDFYSKADDVIAFLPNHEQKERIETVYTPKSKEVLDFKKRLLNEKP